MQPKNILITDQDLNRGVQTARLLKRLDYNAFVTTNADDFVKIISTIAPSLVILDGAMPSVDGMNCMEIMDTFKGLDEVKKLVIKDRSTDDADGADVSLERPVSPSGLYEKIQRLIEQTPRSSIRIKTLIRVGIFHNDTTRISFATMISERGLFIKTLNPMEVGTKFKLSLDLPRRALGDACGEVIYVIKGSMDECEPGMGIRFIDCDSVFEEEIRHYVEDRVCGRLIDYAV